MSYPELYSDERIVLQAQNVKVKSVSFEVVLTTRRLVLVDTKKNSIPPQEINLATLKDVESGENAIRDPTITISIITISGNTRQMVLTFSKISGGERRRECDDWVRALRQNITTTVYHPVSPAPAPKETQPAVQPPVTAPHRIEITNNPPPKKRIELARPMKKIVEAAPAMPVPVETTSLPTGSFCNRCGNRVPPDSAFCNRCGTPVIHDTGSGYQSPEQTDVLPQQSATTVPQVRITPQPVSGITLDKKDSPIEDVIHSIEPLIEDSVPRTAPAPLVPAKHTPPQVSHEPSDEVPMILNAETPAGGATPGIQWPVLSNSETAGTSPSPDAASQTPAASLPQRLPPPAPSKKPHYMMIAVLTLSVIALFVGAYMFISSQPGASTTTPTVTPTPVIPATTVVTITTVPQQTTPITVTTTQTASSTVTVPTTGVWVKVTYPNTFSGMVGIPGGLDNISGTGTRLYQISTIDDPVSVSIQKGDGSASELAVDVYKNGELMKHSQTITPKGIIEMQVILKPAVTANTTTTTKTP